MLVVADPYEQFSRELPNKFSRLNRWVTTLSLFSFLFLLAFAQATPAYAQTFHSEVKLIYFSTNDLVAGNNFSLINNTGNSVDLSSGTFSVTTDNLGSAEGQQASVILKYAGQNFVWDSQIMRWRTPEGKFIIEGTFCQEANTGTGCPINSNRDGWATTNSYDSPCPILGAGAQFPSEGDVTMCTGTSGFAMNLGKSYTYGWYLKINPQAIFDHVAEQVYRIYKDTDVLTSYDQVFAQWRATTPVPNTATRFAPRDNEYLRPAAQDLAHFTLMYLYRYKQYRNANDLAKAQTYLNRIIDTYPQWKHFWQTPATMHNLAYDMWYGWSWFDDQMKLKFLKVLEDEANYWTQVTKTIKNTPSSTNIPIEAGRGGPDRCPYKKDSSGQPLFQRDSNGNIVYDTDGNPFVVPDSNSSICPLGCKYYSSSNMVYCEPGNLALITTDPLTSYHLLDTRAEESAWNTSFLAMAVNMFPNHLHAERWKKATRVFAFHVFSKGETDPVPDYGITTRTINNDGLLGNHNIYPNLNYTLGSFANLMQSQFSYLLAGTNIPSELLHNVENRLNSDVWQRNLGSCLDANFQVLPTNCHRGEDWGQTEYNLTWPLHFWHIPFGDNEAGRLSNRAVAIFYADNKPEIAALRSKAPVASLDFGTSNGERSAWIVNAFYPAMSVKYEAVQKYNDSAYRSTFFPKNLQVSNFIPTYDGEDLTLMLNDYLQRTSIYDLNGDGKVNGLDYGNLLTHYVRSAF